MKEVIVVFDIGKTNKKLLLFDLTLQLLWEKEEQFAEIKDEDGFGCDDLFRISHWIMDSIQSIVREKKYRVFGINFTTYGATLVFLNKDGEPVTPLYNYLKPMPDNVLDGFYEKYGGKEAFSRITASPALGMLNSGLQILWLKRTQPEIFKKTETILHFPQYLSYLLTGQYISEYTSIGCHTALWDFDKHRYHSWLDDEEIHLPAPVSNDQTFAGKTGNTDESIPTGTGLHDSSASLVPYLSGERDPFILLSTGTWCICMNPFNAEPLTFDQLEKDCLCYMSVQGQQVKASRLFLGHLFDVNLKYLETYFKVSPGLYKNVKNKVSILREVSSPENGFPAFFRSGIPEGYVDESIELNVFPAFEYAYHRLMLDITLLAFKSMQLVISATDTTNKIFISGGFANNDLFIHILASLTPHKVVYTTEIDNATALGAAMIMCTSLNAQEAKHFKLNKKRVFPWDEEMQDLFRKLSI